MPKTSESKKEKRESRPSLLSRLITYFKGAWTELGEVRWPTRRATWVLTIAVIAFSGFFVVVILLLDMLFQYLFKLMLG